MNTRQDTNVAVELALLVALATLWGGSYTFIKLGVATIPPVTLIAARTTVAGLLLLAIMWARGIRMPTDGPTWQRFAFQAVLNSVIPWTLIAWGERHVDAARPHDEEQQQAGDRGTRRDQRDRRDGGDAELDESVGAAPERCERDQQRQLDGDVGVLPAIHPLRPVHSALDGT